MASSFRKSCGEVASTVMISGFHGAYRFLSNFYLVQVLYEGILYPSSEHAYQAAKTMDMEERLRISRLPTPALAKKAGKMLKLRPDWEMEKFQVMLDILRIKFQDSDLRQKLLSTGEEELQENNTWGDRVWGICNGVGENHLGRLLMQVRGELRNPTTNHFAWMTAATFREASRPDGFDFEVSDDEDDEEEEPLCVCPTPKPAAIGMCGLCWRPWAEVVDEVPSGTGTSLFDRVPQSTVSLFDQIGLFADVAKPPAHDVHVRRPDPKPSVVYDTYWKFAAERQAIYYRKLRGEMLFADTCAICNTTGTDKAWLNTVDGAGRCPHRIKVLTITKDPILAVHRFTNCYRASDRVSQYLIKNVQYVGDQDPKEVVFRTLLFKIFNKISTWETLTNEFTKMGAFALVENDIHGDNSPIRRILDEAKNRGDTLYSAAYVMPSPGNASSKHRAHLDLLASLDYNKILGATSLENLYHVLLSIPSFGPFLAFQFAIDLNYSNVFPDTAAFSEDSFVVAGPGARDGLKKCFVDPAGYTCEELIAWTTDRQEKEFERLGLTFETLFGRRLRLIDSQNLYCETSKISRLLHPDVEGVSRRTQIKQLYKPDPMPLSAPFFPPKWGLQEPWVARTSGYSDSEVALPLPKSLDVEMIEIEDASTGERRFVRKDACTIPRCGVDCEPGHIRRSRVLTVPCPSCSIKDKANNQRVIHSDCLVVLKTLEDSSVDAVVTDPPYELNMMAHSWDRTGIAFSPDLWREVHRILKPGGHVAFNAAGRVYHRVACVLEDVGFEPREIVPWIFGTGQFLGNTLAEGVGTRIKTGAEPIGIFRKPFEKGLTGAENYAKWGVGGLFIDRCRMPRGEDELDKPDRLMPNAFIDEDVVFELGMRARYFYCVKASREEKDLGLDAFPILSGGKAVNRVEGSVGLLNSRAGAGRTGRGRNPHSTVKPMSLVRRLIRLVCPPGGGLIVDPFAGSGTTLCAAALEGVKAIGIEREADYVEIARARVAHWRKLSLEIAL